MVSLYMQACLPRYLVNCFQAQDTSETVSAAVTKLDLAHSTAPPPAGLSEMASPLSHQQQHLQDVHQRSRASQDTHWPSEKAKRSELLSILWKRTGVWPGTLARQGNLKTVVHPGLSVRRYLAHS